MPFGEGLLQATDPANFSKGPLADTVANVALPGLVVGHILAHEHDAMGY